MYGREHASSLWVRISFGTESLPQIQTNVNGRLSQYRIYDGEWPDGRPLCMGGLAQEGFIEEAYVRPLLVDGKDLD